MMPLSLIPRPATIRENGQAFQLTAAVRIVAETPGAAKAAALLSSYLSTPTGFACPVVTDAPRKGNIVLSESGLNEQDDAGFVREKYSLVVTADGVRLSGNNSESLLRGVQTLRQLFPAALFSPVRVDGVEWTATGVQIEDEPAYRWRGMMLDVSRHFFSKEETCRMIELFAQQKFNRVHIHLTDDQGWRIEIKKYPKLTTIGSIRERTVVGHHSTKPRQYDETPYGGFFTQEDIREIVAFATARGVELVPEIDMPGHMAAAICAYPELGNFPKNQVEVRDTWGISYNILRPTPETMNFMKDVLDEVMDLFPSKFIHIGGDEARKDEWEISHLAQKIMAQHSLKNEEELQAWFSKQMNDFIKSRGRRMIGWDEILEGGLPSGAAVMSWRNEESAQHAAQCGADVVAAYSSQVYFDYYQADSATEPLAICGDLPTEKVYRFSPVLKSMTDDEKAHVMGGQAQLWSEYISTLSYLEYMAFPRACALAEKLWTPLTACNYLDFLQRLKGQRARFGVQNVNQHPLP